MSKDLAHRKGLHYEVPAGFKIEADGYGRNADVITSPHNYFVTIDWANRCFRSGCTTYGDKLNKREYNGAGWKQKLVNDAVNWLVKLGRLG